MLLSESRVAERPTNYGSPQEESLSASGSVTESMDLELVTMPLPEQVDEEIEELNIAEPYAFWSI